MHFADRLRSELGNRCDQQHIGAGRLQLGNLRIARGVGDFVTRSVTYLSQSLPSTSRTPVG